jgi:hypothetical protein
MTQQFLMEAKENVMNTCGQPLHELHGISCSLTQSDVCCVGWQLKKDSFTNLAVMASLQLEPKSGTDAMSHHNL